MNSSTASDPLEAPPSRWKVAKRNARLTFLSAISKLYGGSMSKSQRVPGQEPQVTVGPVIGKVTCTTARILIEVDTTGSLTLELHECHVALEKQPSFLKRQFTSARSKSHKQKQTARRQTVKKIKKSVQACRPSVFMFEYLTPGTKYTVEVKGCRGSILVGSFRTFPEVPAETLTVGVTSCNKIFITELIASQWDLWAHLSKSIEAGKIDLLVHLGDQVSNTSLSCRVACLAYVCQSILYFYKLACKPLKVKCVIMQEQVFICMYFVIVEYLIYRILDYLKTS